MVHSSIASRWSDKVEPGKILGLTLVATMSFILLLGDAILPIQLLVQAFAEIGHHSHFRGGHINWIPTVNEGEVQFTIIDGFRRSGYSGSAPDGMPAVGDIITEFVGGTFLDFGDGSSTGTLDYQVDFIDVTNDWLLGHGVDTSGGGADPILHTYATDGPFEAAIDSCCRTFSENNNPSGTYRVSTTVDLSLTGTLGTNQSPVSSFIPIYTCPVGLCTFAIGAGDADGDDVSFRLSTSSEAAGAFGSFTQPPGLTIDPTTGIVTWDTSAVFTGLWSASVWIDEVRGAANIGHVQNDFLIDVVAGLPTNNPPVFDVPPTPPSGTVFTPFIGDEVSFDVQCSDPDAADTVSIGIIGAPADSTFTGTLSGANPASGTFTWTPSSASVAALTFTCIDNNSASATPHSITILATIPPPDGEGENVLRADAGIISLGGTTNLIQKLDTASGASGTLLSLTVLEADGDTCQADGLPMVIPPSGELVFEYPTEFSLLISGGDGMCDTMDIGVYTAESKVDAGADGVLMGIVEFETNFFVIPESPIGIAAIMGSALAALGGFFFLRKRSRNHSTSGFYGKGLGI